MSMKNSDTSTSAEWGRLYTFRGIRLPEEDEEYNKSRVQSDESYEYFGFPKEYFNLLKKLREENEDNKDKKDAVAKMFGLEHERFYHLEKLDEDTDILQYCKIHSNMSARIFIEFKDLHEKCKKEMGSEENEKELRKRIMKKVSKEIKLKNLWNEYKKARTKSADIPKTFPFYEKAKEQAEAELEILKVIESTQAEEDPPWSA